MPTENINVSQIAVEKQAVGIPLSILHSLRTEFNLQEEEIEPFISNLIDKAILERISENNEKVFSNTETQELEEDLKGLGYI